MIGEYILGIIGIAGMMIAWAFVQQQWGNVVPDEKPDDDVLAGRSDCGSCGCGATCANKVLDKGNKR